MPQSIALIGHGAIAREVIASLQATDGQVVSQVLVRPSRQTMVQIEVGKSIGVVSDLRSLADETDLVLECAGHEAVREHVPPLLERGIDVGIVSIGALADQALHERLKSACERGGARLFVIPGAIGGLDAIAAAGNQLQEVHYISRKPPMSWAGSPAEKNHDLASIGSETEIFSGNARQASSAFPKNANVVASVALAGIGFEATRVSLRADPAATGNTHTIHAKGPLFDFSYTTQGAALASNPKTSALTALSALRCIKSRTCGLVV